MTFDGHIEWHLGLVRFFVAVSYQYFSQISVSVVIGIVVAFVGFILFFRLAARFAITPKVCLANGWRADIFFFVADPSGLCVCDCSCCKFNALHWYASGNVFSK